MRLRIISQAYRSLTLVSNAFSRWRHSRQRQSRPPFFQLRKRILLVRKEAMGDVLLTTPIVRQVRRENPDSYITFLTDWRSEPLLLDNPYIDEVVVRKEHLARRKFDQVIELWYEYEPHLHIVEAYARCANVELHDTHYDLPLLLEHHAYADQMLAQQGYSPHDLLIGVHAYTTWENRCWKADSFRVVLDYFREQYGARIIELGNHADAYLGSGLNLIGSADIQQTAAVLQRCSLLLCIDSLLLHVAGAVDTPVVGLFGPVLPPTRLPMNAISVGCNVADLACIGCHHRSPVPAPKTDCVQTRIYCMEELEPDTVILAMERLLAQTRPGFQPIKTASGNASTSLPSGAL